MQGRLRAVVPRAVDPRGRRHAPEYLILGPGRGGRALVVDEPGEQPAALALDLRVHAAPRRGGADDGVGLEVAEPPPWSRPPRAGCILMLLYIVKCLGVLFWAGDGVNPLDGPLFEFGQAPCSAFDLADAAGWHAQRLADLLLGDAATHAQFA